MALGKDLRSEPIVEPYYRSLIDPCKDPFKGTLFYLLRPLQYIEPSTVLALQ